AKAPARYNESMTLPGVTNQRSCSEQLANNPARYS
ncbi:hypothetical protein A2U01_0116421, partial [Trifolium medium]|nr:hypothetical protein [Trifolium medium]